MFGSSGSIIPDDVRLSVYDRMITERIQEARSSDPEEKSLPSAFVLMRIARLLF